MIKHFYIFRHGQTALNIAGRYQGQSCNEGLNETGTTQAQQLAETLKGKNLEIIFSSPLKRAYETAEIVGKTLNIAILPDDFFIEGNFGVIEGKTKKDLTPQEAEIFIDWAKMDTEFLDVCFEKGETKRVILNRAIEGLKRLLETPYETIGVATHSVVVRMILLYLGKKQHLIPNAQAYHIIYEDGKFHIADKEKTLLLSCCAPCSCAVIQKMAEEKADFAVAFYNPNIQPVAEYEKRRDENLRLCQKHHIPFIELEYDNERWQELTQGLENEPERGKRCSICFYMRLKRTMEYALANGFTSVASVLGVSRYKNLNQVNEMADKAAKATNCPYIEIEGRKNGMQELRAQLITELELYNQTYCGCKPR